LIILSTTQPDPLLILRFSIFMFTVASHPKNFFFLPIAEKHLHPSFMFSLLLLLLSKCLHGLLKRRHRRAIPSEGIGSRVTDRAGHPASEEEGTPGRVAVLVVILSQQVGEENSPVRVPHEIPHRHAARMGHQVETLRQCIREG